MAERTRVAFVGTGGISKSHMRALEANADRVEVVAGVDLDPARLETFCQEYGVAHQYQSIEAMLEAEQPEIVHICTPPGAHTEPAITCLRAGAHVICEKPPTLSLADFDRIQAVE